MSLAEELLNDLGEDELLPGDLPEGNSDLLLVLEEKKRELIQVKEGEDRFLKEAGDTVRRICERGRRALGDIADRFEQDFTFRQVTEYQQELVAFIDEKLTNKLNTESAEELTAYFHKVVDDVTKKVLPPSRDSRHALDSLGQETVGNAKAVTYRLDVRPDCAHLLDDFVPDLDYNFFRIPAWITPLLGKIGMYTTFSRCLPTGLSSALQRGPVMPVLMALGALGGSAFLIRKLMNWKLVLGVGAATSIFYALDWYTDDSKLGKLKYQLVCRLDRELRKSEPTHVSGCINVFRMSLEHFLQGLDVGLNDAIRDIKLNSVRES